MSSTGSDEYNPRSCAQRTAFRHGSSTTERIGGNVDEKTDEQTGGAAEASAAIAEAESHNEPKSGSKDKLEELCVNTIRFLAIDGVEKAKSGHPGAPMGMADMAFVLWTEFMRHDPKQPSWQDRDRFVLSAGHASMLLYSMLHLTGYPLTLDDLNFSATNAFAGFGRPS